MNFKTLYNYTPEYSAEFGVTSTEESMTQQSDLDSSDINVIAKNFGMTGLLPTNPGTPLYGDFTKVTDYRTALEMVTEAREAFEALPAQTKKYFDHSPQALIDFTMNPANAEKAKELGLTETIKILEKKIDEPGLDPAPTE